MYDETINTIIGRIKRAVDRFLNVGVYEVKEMANEVISQIENSSDLNQALAYEDAFIKDSNDLSPLNLENISLMAASSAPSEYENAAARLKQVADAGYKGNEDNCSGSVNAIMENFGITELKGKKANQIIKYVKENWKEISAEEFQRLANEGKPALAVGDINPKGSGHVMVGYPGKGAMKGSGRPGDPKKFYPNVIGGGSEDGRSPGKKTAGDTWKHNGERAKVKYYIPKK